MISSPKHSDPLLSVAALLMPEYVPLSAWHQHAPFAFWLAEALRPKRFVELGTHAGFSYFCFCQAVRQLKLDTTCFAIDTWRGDEHSGFYGEAVFEEVKKQNEKYAHFSTIVRSTFAEARSLFADRSIDLLHIDGRHFYEDVKGDFESWLVKLSDNAIVLFHDTSVRDQGFGVWKFFGELKEKYPTFEFLHGHGLGVVAVKNIPVFLRPLFDATGESQTELRNFFEALGGGICEKSQSAAADARDRAQNSVLLRSSEKLLQIREELKRSLEEQRTSDEKLQAFEKTFLNNAAVELSRRAFQLRKRSPRFIKLYSKALNFFNPGGAQLRALRSSIFFDSDWYLRAYPDVAEARVDPAKHYLEHGAREERNPGPFFSTADYLRSNPDVVSLGINPLLHFDRRGWREQRNFLASEAPILTDGDRRAIAEHIADMGLRPLISIVMPVYNTPERFLREAIQSVIEQRYENWELCIADDASTDQHVANVLSEFKERDPRIKVVYRKENGHISRATNSAIELAVGEFIALMDHDDTLSETALYEVAVAINRKPDVDVIYSDEDRIDQHGRKFNSYYKPNFDPELVLGQNMVSHLGVYRRGLINQIGGLRPGFEGSQDYDLTLRAWSRSSADKILHIPAILYHWRGATDAPSFSEAQLDKCTAAARRSIQEFLDREGEGAKVVAAPEAKDYSRVIRQIPQPHPLVSVIIPTKDRSKLLSKAVDGVLRQTDYQNVEVIIVDHESKERATFALFDRIRDDPRVRILGYSGPFNYSAMNNMAVQEAKGDILALLNNDVEVLDPGWLTEMVSHAVRREIGAVGAKLFYPDGRIQHAGVVVGFGGVAGHAFLFAPQRYPGYFAQAMLTRAVSAVTGACLVVRKSLYFEVDGLNEIELPVAFNDIDFCLKLQAKGYRNVWTPFAQLIHHESVSRGLEDSPEKQRRFRKECDYMIGKWRDVIADDPFYNPNLTLESSTYEAAKRSRRPNPWSAYLGINKQRTSVLK